MGSSPSSAPHPAQCSAVGTLMWKHRAQRTVATPEPQNEHRRAAPVMGAPQEGQWTSPDTRVSMIARYHSPTMFLDNAEKHRFELDVPGGAAFATYRRAPGVVTVLHTEVPEALQGRGIGSELARSILETIRERGEKVVPRCPFLSSFIERHPEYRNLVQG